MTVGCEEEATSSEGTEENLEVIVNHDHGSLIMTTLFNLMHHVGDDNYHPDADAAWRASSPLLLSGRS